MGSIETIQFEIEGHESRPFFRKLQTPINPEYGSAFANEGNRPLGFRFVGKFRADCIIYGITPGRDVRNEYFMGVEGGLTLPEFPF